MALPKSPRQSLTEKTEIVLPQHANAIGTAFGGTIMSWIDICAAVAAQKHCGQVAVTASVDALDFVAPIRVGDVVTLRAWVNAAFGTSLEVECIVDREQFNGEERIRCADALLTFVNLELGTGKPSPVPALELTSDDERRRFAEATARREDRLAKRKAGLRG